MAIARSAVLLGLSGACALAQVPLALAHPEPAARFCRSKVRYFGIGSVTAEYRLERTIGAFPYRVPPHALPVIVGHTGTMGGTGFFESERWQVGRLLGRSACRFLTDVRPRLRQTITDRHGRRVGMIIAKLITATPGTAP